MTEELIHSFVKIMFGSSSTSEQLSALKDAALIVDKPECPQLKMILRLVLSTETLYRYSSTRRAVTELLQRSMHANAQTTMVLMIKSMEGIAMKHANVPTPYRDKSARCLLALKWSCLIAEYVAKDNYKNTNLWSSISTLQAVLYDGAVASGYKPIATSAYRKLVAFWKMVPTSLFNLYYDVLSKSNKYVAHGCGLLAAIATYKSSEFVDNQTKFWDLFVKGVVMSKSKPTESILRSCQPALRHIHHDEFTKLFLPAFKKTLLRSPENVIATVTSVLDSMSIDLSLHAVEIATMLSPHVASKNDACRYAAVATFTALAKQCSDSSVIDEVVKLLFKVLKGSQGALSLPTQKVSVVSCIAALSHAPTGLSQTAIDVAIATVDALTSCFQMDMAETLACAIMTSIAQWGDKFRNKLPSSLMAWFKKMLESNKLHSTAKIAILDILVKILNRNTFEQASVLLPLLMKCLEKANAQPLQWPIVIEALLAAIILCRMASCDIKTNEIKQSCLWTTLLDTHKRVLTSGKFLSHASPSVYCHLVELCGCLLSLHADVFTGDKALPYCEVVVASLLHVDYEVRKKATQFVKKLFSNTADFTLPCMLISELSKTLQPSKVINFDAVECTQEVQRSYVTPQRFERCLKTLLSIPSLRNNAKASNEMALLVLDDCYHPCIMNTSLSVWTDFLFQVGLDADDFIATNIDTITKRYIRCNQHTKASLSALTDLIRISPHQLMPLVVTEVRSVFTDPQMSVSNHNMGILNTPEGTLYNINAVLSVEKIAENKNIKRENKLYSHKDQMMALEMEKELKSKTGKSTDPLANLNKKQQQVMNAELEKETEIRKKLIEVQAIFKSRCEIVESCFSQQYSQMLSRYVPVLSRLVLSLISSHLTSESAQSLYVLLGKCVMPEKLTKTGLQMSYAVLRTLDPAVPVDEEWTDEELTAVVRRVIANITDMVKGTLPASCFACVFVFFMEVLRNGAALIGADETIVTNVLEMTLRHAKLRFDPGVDIEDGPTLLPRCKMLDCMCQLIGVSTPDIQALASNVFVNTCCAMNTQECDYKVYREEMEVIMNAMRSPILSMRLTAAKGLHEMVPLLPQTKTSPEELGRNILRRIFVMVHDEESECQDVAMEIWDELNAAPDKHMCSDILDDIVHHEQLIQNSAATALCEALKMNRVYVPHLLTLLINLYTEKLYQPPPVFDNFGRVISEIQMDDFQSRIGIALSLKKLSPILEDQEIQTVFKLMVPDALKDRHPEVRQKMLDAALQILNDHGKKNKDYLLELFEEFLKNAPTSESFDCVRQSVVILMGSLARHLDKSDPKIKPIAAKLTEALSTPSQQVQEAIAKCLPPLVPAIREEAPEIVKKLLVILLESENFGERKGAAYGLAGMVKGLGIIAFKQLDIMATLTEAVQDKKNYRHKEGALFAFEMFCSMLGRLFEPYIVHVLPHLLVCFGDKNEYVREAAEETARTVMKNLSGHGVKLVLPSLLSALKEDSWRTKTGSVELLGAMAYCAPKQLSSCLPNVVPKLCEIITDSHPKVQNAGQQALKQIGSVIRNPEIKAITPKLLAALSDPSRKTATCLETLLNTKFVHFIDAASLALILPVVHRAFQDRSTDTRKMAAQIIRNMYSLTDQKDLNPYLPSMVPGLKVTLLDPVPEVRGIAAKALGSMVKGTGESLFEELLPWLMETITSEQSSVDRSGGAQGLSEVLFALGTKQLKKLMPEIMKMASTVDVMPHVRDGYIMMFIFLPSAFKEEFTQFIGDIIPIILQALSDETEFLRETALCAGQRIITMYAETTISLLLPELERGLFDDNWRIRFSSVQLLGDLLFHISGVSGKMSASGAEDDNFGTNEGLKTVMSVLGDERSHHVLSGLYMGRLDVALLVRQAALHVWKIIVPNTARLLREILTTLFHLLINCLSSSSYDKRQVAAKTLGDVVRKLGERMLPEIIPILERGLDTEDADQREGVCIGLSEIIKSCSKDAILTFTDNLVPSVCKSLCDKVPEVRVAAATTFDNLHTTIGVKALEDVMPTLLHKLNESEDIEPVIDGLRQIIAVKGRVVMPFIVPKLIEPPINTFVLAHMSAVAGESLSKHLNVILKALLSALEKAYLSSDVQFSSMLADAVTVVLSVEGEHGARITIDYLLEACRSHNPNTRFVAVSLLNPFCQNTEEDYSDYVSMFIRSFFKLMADEKEETQVQAWEGLQSVTKRLDAVDMLQHVSSLRQAARFVKDDLNEDGVLPGLALPKKGLTPIIPIFREGILNGSPDHKEQAAKGLTDCIKLTTSTALKPSVVSITGPLIRILGDRFGQTVRVAVLDTLSALLDKAGMFLKPFLPQLQTTFSKALQDSNRSVRLSASTALRNLVVVHPRLDPLFTDLNNNIKNAEDDALRETTLHALRGCIKGAGGKMGNAVRAQMTVTLCTLLSHNNEIISKCAAGCLACLCDVMPEEEVDIVAKEQIFIKDTDDDSWETRQGRSLLFATAIHEASDKFLDGHKIEVVDKIKSYANSDRIQLVCNGVRAGCYALLHTNMDLAKPLSDVFKKLLQHPSNDVKVCVCDGLAWVYNSVYDKQEQPAIKFISNLVVEMLPITREKNTTVKSSAEYGIVEALNLRKEDGKRLEECQNSISSKDATSLGELYKQRLKRLSTLPSTVRNIDNTLLPAS